MKTLNSWSVGNKRFCHIMFMPTFCMSGLQTSIFDTIACLLTCLPPAPVTWRLFLFLYVTTSWCVSHTWKGSCSKESCSVFRTECFSRYCLFFFKFYFWTTHTTEPRSWVATDKWCNSRFPPVPPYSNCLITYMTRILHWDPYHHSDGTDGFRSQCLRRTWWKGVKCNAHCWTG